MRWESEPGAWDAQVILDGIDLPGAISLGATQLTDLRPVLWNDLCSEYDSRFLDAEIQKRVSLWSSEFLSFAAAWRIDEDNHYKGFLKIFSTLYGQNEQEIGLELGKRSPDFASMMSFLDDEFRLCLLLAYDEIATTRSYAEDAQFYASLGPEQFRDWSRLLTSDEARHFMNLLRVLSSVHRPLNSRAWRKRVEQTLEEIIALDMRRDYCATFVLDHEGPPFSDEMLVGCTKIILKDLTRS